MNISIDGILSIISFEAVVLKTYVDSAGHATIGIGHTKMAGAPSPVEGMRISLEDAVRLFQKDIQKHESEVEATIKVPLSQNEFDAVVSWHFNTGAVFNSTLTEKLNKKDKAGAAKEFARWNKATVKGEKVELAGLTRRRARETAIFKNSNYGDEDILVDTGDAGGKKTWSKEDFKSKIAQERSDRPSTPLDPEEELSTQELLANPSSRLLPRYRPRQNDATSRATIKKFEHLLPVSRRQDAVMVLGVRGYYTDTMGRAGINDRGLYDDAVFVVTPDEIFNFNGNTDPSRSRHGIAVLKSPQAVKYRPGLHGFNRKAGPYPAFRQASACTVIRDGTGEDTDGNGNFFWINFHRGGNTTTSSLGCQTIPPNQWTEFKHLIDTLLHKHGQTDFYYLLVNEEDKAMVETQQSPDVESVPLPIASVSQEVAEIRAILQTLDKRLDGLAAATTISSTALPDDPVAIANELEPAVKSVLQLEGLKDRPIGEVIQTIGHALAKPPLTPVNNALGPLVGNLLNGKKTVIGTVGLLATMLIPELQPLIKATGPVVDAMAAVKPTLATLFGAATGWGVLGKIDKYFHNRKP